MTNTSEKYEKTQQGNLLGSHGHGGGVVLLVMAGVK